MEPLSRPRGCNPGHRSVTSVDQFAAAEAAGKLVIMNPGASDPCQLWTSAIFVRPIVGPNP
jgi:hypothetical protein